MTQLISVNQPRPPKFSVVSALIRVRVRYGIRGSTLTPVGRHTPHFQVRSHMIIRTRCCGILVMDVGVLAFSGMMSVSHAMAITEPIDAASPNTSPSTRAGWLRSRL